MDDEYHVLIVPPSIGQLLRADADFAAFCADRGHEKEPLFVGRLGVFGGNELEQWLAEQWRQLRELGLIRERE